MKIGITAGHGKMGTEVTKFLTALNNKEIEIVGITSRNQNDSKNSPQHVIANSDIVIDFSSPSHSMEIFEIARRHNTAVVCGTTGFSDAQFEHMSKCSKYIRIFYSPNMSIAVNLLKKISAKAAAVLSDFDVEIIEYHHRNKKDAPSGTALMLGNNILNARNLPLTNKTFNRFDVNDKREHNKIGFSSIRGGSVVGKHNVMLISDDESIELSHSMFNRSVYAKNSYLIAKWLLTQNVGLYDMDEFINQIEAKI